MAAKKPFYITTAISYVNGSPHLGHAYEVILTDVMARFKRLDGYDVMFLTGTDEHGEKVAKTAEKNNMSPQDFADKNAAEFIQMAKFLNISNDDFIRTTEKRHYEASQALWRKLEEAGDIYLGKYEGWYSVREEAYFTDSELKDGADGAKLSPNGTEVKWVKEESYFFKLSKYTDKLLDYYKNHPDFITPSTRANEIISFVSQEGGLKDLSISRHKDRLTWGIPVPGDDNHVMYVWLDALTNYMTAIGYPETDSGSFKKFWPADYHVIGKDIIRFHAVYWPAFLMSAGIEIPKRIFAHGFINVQGEKMSKSLGNVMAPAALIETYGLDNIRYFLMREIAHGQDGNFSHEQAVQRINADLANGIGNLAQRTLSMIHKNCDAKIPSFDITHYNDDQKDIYDDIMNFSYLLGIDPIPESGTIGRGIRGDMGRMHAHKALELIWNVISLCDTYIDFQAPWALKKSDPDKMASVLYAIAETLRKTSILLQPFMPTAAAKLLDQLKVPQDQRQFAHIDAQYALKPGTAIDKPEGVFPRIVEETEPQKAAG